MTKIRLGALESAVGIVRAGKLVNDALTEQLDVGLGFKQNLTNGRGGDRLEKHGLSGFEDRTLVRRSDGFSNQFSDQTDPRFWLRILKPTQDPVLVTDLLFGDQDEYGMAQALAQALQVIGLHRPRTIVFLNLGLADDLATAQAVDRVQKVVEALVLRQRRFISETRTELVRQKVNLIVSFRNFD